jgi:hypothetical protein
VGVACGQNAGCVVSPCGAWLLLLQPSPVQLAQMLPLVLLLLLLQRV